MREIEYKEQMNKFQRSLKNLEKSKQASITQDFVIEGTAMNFSLTFDLALVALKNIMTEYYRISEVTVHSPGAAIKEGLRNGIITSEEWFNMLILRNRLLCDYDNKIAKDSFTAIVTTYYELFDDLNKKITEKYSCIQTNTANMSKTLEEQRLAWIEEGRKEEQREIILAMIDNGIPADLINKVIKEGESL